MKLLKNISVLLLVLLICFNSSAATLSVHFCSGKLNSVSFSEKAGCGMELQLCKSPNSHLKKSVEKNNSCCKNLLIKSKPKVQNLEKTEKSSLSSNLIKVTFPFCSQALALVPFHLRLVNYINFHRQRDLLSPKNSIYLVVQNFRN